MSKQHDSHSHGPGHHHGASSPAELVTTASFLGYEAIAITDECSVAGVVRAFDEITHQGLPIKLIVGSYFIFDKTLSFAIPNPSAEKAFGGASILLP